MTWLEHGRIQGGTIVLPKPLPLPEGTEVTVRIETVGDSKPAAEQSGNLISLPFFGMWADRSDMADGSEWLRKERQKWQQRPGRQD